MKLRTRKRVSKKEGMEEEKHTGRSHENPITRTLRPNTFPITRRALYHEALLAGVPIGRIRHVRTATKQIKPSKENSRLLSLAGGIRLMRQYGQQEDSTIRAIG